MYIYILLTYYFYLGGGGVPTCNLTASSPHFVKIFFHENCQQYCIIVDSHVHAVCLCRTSSESVVEDTVLDNVTLEVTEGGDLEVTVM